MKQNVLTLDKLKDVFEQLNREIILSEILD